MKKIELRHVVENDVHLVLKWSNDPLTRKMSFNTRTISKEEHNRWFSKQLSSSSDRMFIAMYDNTPIGLCRFHYFDSRTWEIGINLCRKFRGKNLGYKVLVLGCEAMRAEFPGCRILARTRPVNLSFVSIAKAAGFKIIQTTLVNDQKALELTLE